MGKLRDMDSWKTPSFILLWDMSPIGKTQQGFFEVPKYAQPEYFALSHPDDLATVTKIIEEKINQIDVGTWQEAREYAESQKLTLVGGIEDYDNYWSYRYRATVHGVPDELWMTDLANGKLTHLLSNYPTG